MDRLSRKDFLKLAGFTVLGLAGCKFGDAATQTASTAGQPVNAATADGISRAKVYFTDKINEDSMVKLYKLINSDIYGKVALKIHTGEQGGKNFLSRSFVKAVQEQIPGSVIVETNTAYGGRSTTERHRETIMANGWDFCPVDIMDEHGAVMLPVRGGKHFTEMSVGKSLVDYDSMVVLTHFKGHSMGGYGGSLKNIAIGCADGEVGKIMQHGRGFSVRNAAFMENMVEAGKAVTDFFGKHIVYINVMRRMSVDCDCAGRSAAEPTIGDIGILASTDILAIDQASVDLVYNKPGGDNKDLIERIESREGLRQLSYMRELKMGNPNYELINV
jgi:uncharacterized Fe-S center protein